MRMLTSVEFDELVHKSAMAEDSCRAAIKRGAYKMLEVNSGSASLEAAGDARKAFEAWALKQGSPEQGWWLRQLPDGGYSARNPDIAWMAWKAALATPATQASKDRALFISGAAGPLGEPEILGSPTDSQDAKRYRWLRDAAEGPLWAAAYDAFGEDREASEKDAAIDAAMSANTTKETE